MPFSMQTSPEELEKLLLKKKPNTGPLPSVEKIPDRESIRFVVRPPIKNASMTLGDV